MVLNSIQRLWQQHKTRQQEDTHLIESIDIISELADPTIKRASRYRKVLRPHVIHARNYCASLIKSIPGPIQLDRNSYYQDPTVKALFISADHFKDLLLQSPELNTFRQSRYSGKIVALLTMTKEEKTSFGHQKQGEIILRDMAQKTVNFIDHRIVAPTTNLELSQALMVDRGLEALATVAMERITGLRTRVAELRDKRDYLKGSISIFKGRTRLQTRFTVPDPEMREELAKAEMTLAKIERELETALNLLSYPEDALRFLSEILEQHAEFLTVINIPLHLNWMNVLVDTRTETEGNAITLAEFALAYQLRRYAIFVTFEIEEFS